ncbi:type II toxin-antitoxin system Phd/YefM family antitoxin [Cellulomonas sp. APG4]|nr:type II toxin-antitoxin system Phd/YefM family antitoxin [Cellulomonas sp. APG4]
MQEAKQRLSEVLRAAEAGEPQVISRHGEEVAVVIDIASYRRLAGVSVEFVDHLRHGPTFAGLELDGLRSDEPPREIDLSSTPGPDR